MIINKVEERRYTRRCVPSSFSDRSHLSFECWRRENKDTVEFVHVSKWKSQDAFEAWISQDEHVNGHKKMNKTLRAFELYDSLEN
ncbi:antibiotic biosynthesis monooxygenase family protein [Aneurinibacillus aneurinilyticus]|uniref:antibiotic biosynthesis monooxygenase family protein n=1 Tax=Aneurinibacillus aneurinilyticus TaxID=1391 RepID=UPI001F0DDB14|nr:antibiotic biosynthesis monooxygenase [Aneurinibacillus aneurinilyticus]